MEKDIYNLKLHESISGNDGITIIRVPGGWIYDIWDIEKDTSRPGTFIPYSDEFKPKKAKQKELFPEESKTFNFKKSLIELGVDKQIATDYMKLRTKTKAADSLTAFNLLKKQLLILVAQLKGVTIDNCLEKAIEKSWRGFKADWYINDLSKDNTDGETTTVGGY